MTTLMEFKQALVSNPGVFIMKLGAHWCGPCRQIEPLVNSAMDQAPDNVQCAVVDVDQAAEIYSFLKSKRMVGGIPVILLYYKDNMNYIPDDIVVGADPKQIAELFARGYQTALNM